MFSQAKPPAAPEALAPGSALVPAGRSPRSMPPGCHWQCPTNRPWRPSPPRPADRRILRPPESSAPPCRFSFPGSSARSSGPFLGHSRRRGQAAPVADAFDGGAVEARTMSSVGSSVRLRDRAVGDPFQKRSAGRLPELEGRQPDRGEGRVEIGSEGDVVEPDDRLTSSGTRSPVVAQGADGAEGDDVAGHERPRRMSSRARRPSHGGMAARGVEGGLADQRLVDRQPGPAQRRAGIPASRSCAAVYTSGAFVMQAIRR